MGASGHDGKSVRRATQVPGSRGIRHWRATNKATKENPSATGDNSAFSGIATSLQIAVGRTKRQTSKQTNPRPTKINHHGSLVEAMVRGENGVVALSEAEIT